ncbi:DNA helicase PIF1 ATP-dependent [Macrophomina phaseolina MS6]|uniref:ATP-dependent DNA helicase n=1 Tax=Macrophomina phaseolina (strain MS6) TaxID=1126212 RepID=K2QHN7_MACPH|nr:DNA helicase PIF1 ATP-dependent [Macrophomina phaseolina MS6]
MKIQHPKAAVVGPVSQGAEDSLASQQRKIFDLYMAHFAQTLRWEQRQSRTSQGSQDQPQQLNMNIDGKAGAGKSYLIRVLSARLEELAAQNDLPNPIIRAAPTGVAASKMDGSTLHSLLRIPTKGDYTSLTDANAAPVEATFRNCRYLVIDEKSMVSLKLLNWVDQRLR